MLVRQEHLPRAVDVLRARGYKPIQPFQIDDDPAAQHLTPLVRDGVARIEIHWNITPPLDPNAINPEELWHRAVPWSSGNTSALGLSLEDLLLHLCFHASFQHRFRSGWSQALLRCRNHPCRARPERRLGAADLPGARLALGQGSLSVAAARAGPPRRWGPRFSAGRAAPGRCGQEGARGGRGSTLRAAVAPRGRRTAGGTRAHVSQAPKYRSLDSPSAKRDACSQRESWRSLYRVWLRLARGGYLLRTHGRSVLRLLFKTDPDVNRHRRAHEPYSKLAGSDRSLSH